jgi:hypothetical protein
MSFVSVEPPVAPVVLVGPGAKLGLRLRLRRVVCKFRLRLAAGLGVAAQRFARFFGHFAIAIRLRDSDVIVCLGPVFDAAIGRCHPVFLLLRDVLVRVLLGLSNVFAHFLRRFLPIATCGTERKAQDRGSDE